MSDKHYYMYKLHTCTYKLHSFFKKCKNYLSVDKYPPSGRSYRKKNDLTIINQFLQGSEVLTEYAKVLTEVVFGTER